MKNFVFCHKIVTIFLNFKPCMDERSWLVKLWLHPSKLWNAMMLRVPLSPLIRGGWRNGIHLVNFDNDGWQSSKMSTLKSFCKEVVQPSGSSACLKIRRSWVQDPLWPFNKFDPGFPWINFPAALVNSQLFCGWPVGKLTVVVVLCCRFVDYVPLAL